MKTIISLALCLTVSLASAQKIKEAEVPSAVKEAFAKKFPGAKAEKWEKENAEYEAEFDWEKTESSALFDATGTFKELEQEIKTSALPAGVSDYCKKNFAGWKMDEASKIEGADGKVSYEAEMEKGEEHFDAFFDEKGNFLKKGAIEKEKDKKD